MKNTKEKNTSTYTPTSDLALERTDVTSQITELHGHTVTHSVCADVRAITVHLDIASTKAEQQKRLASLAVSEAIKELVPPEILNSNAPVTVICLGNSSLTCDSLGALCSKELLATRHLRYTDRELFDVLGGREISVIHTGTEGETGISSLEVARLCVSALRPSLVITVDALRAAHSEHLCSVVQITNGITPGSGTRDKRASINEKTLGVPVVSVGAPTAVSLRLLVSESLARLQKSVSIAPVTLQTQLYDDFLQGNFLVSRSDCDIAIKELSYIISMAINRILLGDRVPK